MISDKNLHIVKNRRAQAESFGITLRAVKIERLQYMANNLDFLNQVTAEDNIDLVVCDNSHTDIEECFVDVVSTAFLNEIADNNTANKIAKEHLMGLGE